MVRNPASDNETIIEKLLTIVNSISDGVLAVDLDMRVTFFNRAAEQITGSRQEDVIGRQCREVFRTDMCDNDCALRETFRTGKPVIHKFICSTHAEGRRVPISVSTALLKDKQGNIIGGVETFRDLSQVEALQKTLESSYTFADMIGRSGQMQEMFKLLPLIAESESTLLIEGESGTGKELIAKAVHSHSLRKNKPLVVVNCGAIPDQLLESELFGYKAGAFTDAKKDKPGRFALAEGGTLFLDEIGDLSPSLQVKLLRVLQSHTYDPLGSTHPETADVRIIAATNRSLVEMMEKGLFRQDLYYRLNVISVKVPPLRERASDIPLLVDHFIGRLNLLRNKDISGVAPAAMSVLLNYSYPGNVRELENIIEHAFVLCPGGIIRPEHLPARIKSERPIPAVEVASSLEEMESLFLAASLKRNNWSRKKTADELGIHPSTLYRRIKKLGLTFPHSTDTA